MSRGKFLGLLALTVVGTAAVGVVVIAAVTTKTGTHRGWRWRVNLADASRAWAVWIAPPGGELEVVNATSRANGHDYAIATAKAEIEKRA